jgi:UDP-GlcNAc:undecaprenyl-phosphate/decaprenyl-phosphate GlcNAc-1-phosphate transferase
VAVVAINRVRRGQSAVHFDNSHMHYRLLATGLSVKQICLLFYGLTIMFGVLALRLSHIYKFIGLALVALTMFCLILFVDSRLRQRGVPLQPDPEPTPGGEAEQSSKQQAGKPGSESRRHATAEYSEQPLHIRPSTHA